MWKFVPVSPRHALVSGASWPGCALAAAQPLSWRPRGSPLPSRHPHPSPPLARLGKILRPYLKRLVRGEHPPPPATIEDPAVLGELRALLAPYLARGQAHLDGP